MRWLVSIVVCVAFAAGAVLLFQSLGEYNTAKTQLLALQQERGDYERLARDYDTQEQRVAAVNSLWGELQSVNLKPGDWTRFPLSVSKALDWKDVERLLILSSNRLKDDPGYYFKPEMLRLSRVVVGQDGQPVTAGESAPGEAAAGAAAGLAPVQKFDTTIRGAFLIPKSAE